jgi:hypothetical protein
MCDVSHSEGHHLRRRAERREEEHGLSGVRCRTSTVPHGLPIHTPLPVRYVSCRERCLYTHSLPVLYVMYMDIYTVCIHSYREGCLYILQGGVSISQGGVSILQGGVSVHHGHRSLTNQHCHLSDAQHPCRLRAYGTLHVYHITSHHITSQRIIS